MGGGINHPLIWCEWLHQATNQKKILLSILYTLLLSLAILSFIHPPDSFLSSTALSMSSVQQTVPFTLVDTLVRPHSLSIPHTTLPLCTLQIFLISFLQIQWPKLFHYLNSVCSAGCMKTIFMLTFQFNIPYSLLLSSLLLSFIHTPHNFPCFHYLSTSSSHQTVPIILADTLARPDRF